MSMGTRESSFKWIFGTAEGALANQTGARRILTGDRADFETFRLTGGKRFALLDWH